MNYKILLFIILLLLIIYLYYKRIYRSYTYKNKYKLDTYKIPKKPYLWIYWDDISVRSGYIQLCIDTIYKNSFDFNLIFLNRNNILDYLPEIKSYDMYFEDLILAQKVDIYRIWLMYKYGGLYMDTDTILFKSPIKLYELLIKYDYIGYGCTGKICFPKGAYGYPSNGIIFSRPNTLLMKNILNKCLDKIKINYKKYDYKDKNSYYDLGKLIIWDELKNITKFIPNYKYYHIDKEVGIRDENGIWITPQRIFSKEKYKFYGDSELIMIPLYNNMMEEYKKYSVDDILNLDYNITYYFKKALK